jgi:hypothetical protein
MVFEVLHDDGRLLAQVLDTTVFNPRTKEIIGTCRNGKLYDLENEFICALRVFNLDRSVSAQASEKLVSLVAYGSKTKHSK